jgi:hypothetical protein
MLYRFVGTRAEVGSVELELFGAKIDLSQEDADANRKGGLAIIPDDIFEEIGFTPEELRLYGMTGQQIGAPPDFLKRVELARSLFVDEYARLNSDAVPTPIAEPITPFDGGE